MSFISFQLHYYIIILNFCSILQFPTLHPIRYNLDVYPVTLDIKYTEEDIIIIMKKKLLALFMGVTLVAGTAGCGNSAAPAATTPDPAQGSETETASDAENKNESAAGASSDATASDPAKDEAGAKAEAETDEAATNAPQFLSRSSYYYENDDSGKFTEPFSKGNIETLKLTDQSAAKYPEFAKAFEEYMSAREGNAKEQFDTFTAENKDYRASIDKPGENDHIYEAYLYEDQFLRRVDDKYVSIMSSTESYAGGAHGYTAYSSMTYDINTGETVALKDVIPDEEKFKTTLEEKLLELYTIDEFMIMDEAAGLSGALLPFIQNEYEPDAVDPSDPASAVHLNWSLDPDGVLIYFNAYDIAPFSTGTVTALIPYSCGIVADKFIPDGACSFVSRLPRAMYILTDADGDGKTDKYDTFANHVDDDYTSTDFESLEITCGEKKTKIEDTFFGYEQYLLCKGDKRFLLLCLDSYNDYTYLYEVPLPGGSVGESTLLTPDIFTFAVYDSQEDAYYSSCPTDTSNLVLGTRLNLLSTYTGLKTYSLEDDGTITTKDEYFAVDVHNPITSVKPIKCDILDDSYKSTGEETLPEGTNFTIFQTDGLTGVDCTIDDGRKVRLTFDEPQTPEASGIKIGGIDQFDLFKELYYAG